jgi:acetoin:2,6-dichlorophenolindophenol oxidoreductase subunit alpha
LLEVRTARLAGHYEGDKQSYREDGEGERIAELDPVVRLRQRLHTVLPDAASELQAIDDTIGQLLADAWSFAEASPLPEPKETLTDAYTSYGEVG